MGVCSALFLAFFRRPLAQWFRRGIDRLSRKKGGCLQTHSITFLCTSKFSARSCQKCQRAIWMPLLSPGLACRIHWIMCSFASLVVHKCELHLSIKYGSGNM
uniref:Secreted protein n=1 Tax=Ixodes ricinus TaxID=34613 RepID=A0A6B0UF91_IXORI